ncbi:peptidoglycan DL-endopeptidase CwlO-like [Ptychodera flava]|uniref:peptidoglycan DL-endopeptidase CwlO-like n=1 Tax=Ptychodera flava TaxID=63121 RepID=UPI00396A8D29
MCLIDLKQPGINADEQRKFEVLKASSLGDEMSQFCEQHQEKLAELNSAQAEQLNEVAMELERARKEKNDIKNKLDNKLKELNAAAEIRESQINECREEKSVLDNEYERRQKELARADKIATDKGIENSALKDKIKDLEEKLNASQDLMNRFEADKDNITLESKNPKEKLDNAIKETANLTYQLETVVKEGNKIQEELDNARKEMLNLEMKLNESRACYPSNLEKIDKVYGGHKWTLQVLGSMSLVQSQDSLIIQMVWHGMEISL